MMMTKKVLVYVLIFLLNIDANLEKKVKTNIIEIDEKRK